MAPRTRSVTSSPVKQPAPAQTPSSPSKKHLPPPHQHEPLHLMILPDSLSPEARIIFLPSPRDKSKKRFLFCPLKGLYEFTKIAAPQTDYRSILFAPVGDDGPAEVTDDGVEGPISRGYVQKDATFLVATPFDLMFLLLSLIPSSIGNTGKVMFQPLDDLFEAQIAEDANLRYLIQNGKQFVEDSMVNFCDTIDAGDEKMFRISEDKVVRMFYSKAEAVVSRGLPASLEERFVTRALETPVLNIKRETSTITTITREEPMDFDSDLKSGSFNSTSTVISSVAPSVFSEASIASSVTTISPETISSEITHLMHLKVALDFICASYLSPKMSSHLQPKITETGSFADFTPLTAHLKHLASLKAEALASRSLGDFCRKRGIEDDDEVAEDRAEKKRKVEEEEKRKKAGLSRGVKELSKVNVTGMKKMSDFFGKKVVAKMKT